MKCGELTVLLRQASQWTPGRIDYREAPMTTEKSAYGTVFSFPEVGFIGTGHLENEPEPLESLSFFLDGKRIEEPAAELRGETFRFERVSRVRQLHLHGIVELKNGRLYETAIISSEGEVPLKLLYHFMHAWRPTVTAFLAGADEEPDRILRGPLLDTEEENRKFQVNEKVDWVAVYEPESGQFAVSRLLEAPFEGGHVSMIWNVPGTYRKYYLKCFQNSSVPSGFTGTWRMVTAFGASPFDTWEAAALNLARDLREEP